MAVPVSEDTAPADGSVQFGDKAGQPEAQKIPDDAPEFPDNTENPEEVSAEEAMRRIFGEMKESAQSNSEAVAKAEEAAVADSPFVFNLDSADTNAPATQGRKSRAQLLLWRQSQQQSLHLISDDSPTKPVTDINSLFFTASTVPASFSKARLIRNRSCKGDIYSQILKKSLLFLLFLLNLQLPLFP